jgi:hypothetical protein
MPALRRRQFITLLGGAAAAWPLAVRAQQATGIRRIGVLMNQAADDPEAPPRVSAFAQGLQERGWTVGGNIRIDYRWGAGDVDRFRKHAAELVVGPAPAPRRLPSPLLRDWRRPDLLRAQCGRPVPACRRVMSIASSRARNPPIFRCRRLDSERFRSTPRTCGRFRGILSLR